MPHVQVLALHGLLQDGDVLRNKLARIMKDTADVATFHFATAPFIAEGEGITNLTYRKADLGVEADVDCPRRAWFSIRATATAGLADSVRTVNAVAAASGVERFDCVFCFSQGSKMALQLLRAAAGTLAVPDSVEAPPPLHPALMGLRAAVLCGGPFTTDLEGPPPLNIPSLHVVGTGDTLVPPAASFALAEHGFAQEKAHVFTHSGGHYVPSGKEAVAEMRRFFESIKAPDDVDAFHSLVSDELEMLASIFDTDGLEVHRHPATVEVTLPVAAAAIEEYIGETRRLTGATVPHFTTVFKATIDPTYPEEPPMLELLGVPPAVAPYRWVARAVQNAREEAMALVGSPMLLPALSAINDAVTERLRQVAAPSDPEAEAAEEEAGWVEREDGERRHDDILQAYAAARKHSHAFSSAAHVAHRASAAHGENEYVVGLVGKPSAGKSTFFNAVTNPNDELAAAKVGAYPFTTIEPNVGRGFFAAPCPCRDLPDPSVCGARFGHFAGTTDRRVPVVVKDVAGLVPGAYAGHGKGNQFLNDLCDADVLVHVVDGSGQSTADGVDVAGTNLPPSSPLKDVEWVRGELHSWIYDNLRAKWATIERRPLKLLGMFSGYHAGLALVEAALERCGVTPKTIRSEIPLWGSAELHLLVAHFVLLRFPMLIALNKLDAGAAYRLDEAAAQFPEFRFVPMAARVEAALLALRHRGLIEYTSGSSAAAVVPGKEAELSDKEAAAFASAAAFLERTAHTGTTAVLSAAVALRPRLYVYPVAEFHRFHAPGGKTAAHAVDGSGAPLAECALFEHGSTAGDVFRALSKRGLFGPQRSSLVRCEATESVAAGAAHSVVRKDDDLPSREAHILRFITR